MKRVAKVVDINDEKKLGRIKVEILPELQGMPENLLPWACPEQDFDATSDFNIDVPAKDSFVIVEVDDTWTVFSYDGSRPFSEDTTGLNAARDFIGNVGLYSGSDPEPLTMEFSKDPNFLKFRDSTTGEAGIVFSNGRFLYWSGKDGKTLVYGFESKKYIEIQEDSSIKWNNNASKPTTFELKADGSFIYNNTDKKTSITVGANGKINVTCLDATKIDMDDEQIKVNGDNLVIKK